MFAAYQVNFVNIVITGCLTMTVMFISIYLLIRQKSGEKESRRKKASFASEKANMIPPNTVGTEKKVSDEQFLAGVTVVDGAAPTSASASSGVVSTARVDSGGRGISISFVDLTVEARRVIQLVDGSTVKERFQILPGVYGYVRPGTVTCILGPTGCGKSTLLSMLRVGGEGSSGGRVDVKLHSGRGGGHGNSTNTADFANLEAGGSGSGGADEDDQHRSITDRDELKSRIGFVPQDDILDRALTVREVGGDPPIL
jgi:ABC-type multidrug transport system fused ATPase/permease subunit